MENNQFTNFSNLDYKGQEENIYNYQNHLLEVINTMPPKIFQSWVYLELIKIKTDSKKLIKMS